MKLKIRVIHDHENFFGTSHMGISAMVIGVVGEVCVFIP